MHSSSLTRSRRLVGAALLLLAGIGVLWFFSPGIPVFWGPYASAADRAAGQELFEHEWQPKDPLAGGDGLGPVFNARSCVACHFQGGVGGGGNNQHNVHTFEVQPTTRDPQLRIGVLHAAAVDPAYKETQAQLRQQFPIIKGSTRTQGDEHCRYTITIPDFDPLHFDTVNTTALFGDGWIDCISPKAIQAHWMSRAVSGVVKEFSLQFDAVVASGRPRVLPDGRIGKFGWKAQFATLKEFVAAACANELGLSNPLMDQPKPLGKSDYPASQTPDLNKKQFAQLVAFVDTLPRPVEIMPSDPTAKAKAQRGKEVFTTVGCALCHVPDLGGVKGVYSDFLLHSLDNPGPNGGSYDRQDNPQKKPLPEDHPRADEWKTPPLWGVADSAPYFHDGGSATLLHAVLRHGGDARPVTEAFKKQTKQDQEALIAFLETLKAPPEAAPAPRGKR